MVPADSPQGGGVRVPTEPARPALLSRNDNARYQRVAIFAGELLPSRLLPSDLPPVGICVLLGPDGQERVRADGRAAPKTRARDDRDKKKASYASDGPGEGAGVSPRGERVPALRERVLKKKDGAGGEARVPAGYPEWAKSVMTVSILRREYPLDLLLRVSGMSRSTYYHRVRSLRAGSGLSEVDALISSIFHDSRGEYGCRKVAAALERRGVRMNFKTVNRRMRSMGLVCSYRRKRRRRSGGSAGYAPNLLDQNFSASAPLEKLVTDVTEMRVLGGRRLYLSSIIDLHNNLVLAHSVSASNSWTLVRDMLERLERRRGVPEGVMIHSDQGALYRCGEYLKFARSHRIVRSMSGKGCCYDNAVIESHFGNLKGYLGRLDRVPEDKAVEMIDEAVRYFNEERIMLKLGGLSPMEYLRRYMESENKRPKTDSYI